jgi:hypothetical protein
MRPAPERATDVTPIERMRLNARGGAWMLPPHMRQGVTAYVERGQQVGGFLTAIFEGRLDAAQRVADGQNLRCWSAWETFLRHHMPTVAHGSPEAVAKWREHEGLKGIGGAQ